MVCANLVDAGSAWNKTARAAVRMNRDDLHSQGVILSSLCDGQHQAFAEVDAFPQVFADFVEEEGGQ